MIRILAILLIVSTSILGQDFSGKFTTEQEYLFKVFKSRRSVRNFKNTPIPKEHLNKILEIARTAPTSGNQQPWKFLVIQDRNKLDLLKKKAVERRVSLAKNRGVTDKEQINRIIKKADEYFTKFLSAPVYVSVLVDSASTYPSYNRYDGSLAAGYLMIAARALGYGTVFSQDSVPYELIQEVFGIPAQFEQICFTPIGDPLEWPETPKKKELDNFVVKGDFVDGINYHKKISFKKIDLPQQVLKKYLGKYVAGNYKINIIIEDKRLMMQFEGAGSMEIMPYAEDKFFIKSRNVAIEFVKSSEGITKFIWSQAGSVMEGIKQN